MWQIGKATITYTENVALPCGGPSISEALFHEVESECFIHTLKGNVVFQPYPCALKGSIHEANKANTAQTNVKCQIVCSAFAV